MTEGFYLEPQHMPAEYESRCPTCGETIEEGDEIFRDAEVGLWVCEGCGG